MITSKFEIDGETWTVHHNGDFSGDAHIQLPGEPGESGFDTDRLEQVSDGTGWQAFEVKIPMELFRRLGREEFRREAISALESLE